MKKIFGGLGVGMFLLLVVGVFATAAENINSEISEQITKVSDGEISEDIQGYVGNFVEKRGIEAQDVNSVTEVNFDDLPKEVNIENVGDHNLAIYEVDYNEPESGEENKMFVVTYSVEELKAQGDLIIAHDKRQFLNFGFEGEMSESGFLNTATGVEGSLDKGYVMMRKGSITGISTNLEVIDVGEQLEIIIYKNGELIRFGNTLNADLTGVKKDYDVQSKDTVIFEPGDVISVYIKAQGEIIWKDVITMIEITTVD